MEMINPVHYQLFEEVTGPVHYIPRTDPCNLSGGIFVSLDYSPSPLWRNLVQNDVRTSSAAARRSFTVETKHFPATAQEQLLFIFSFYGFSKTELSKILHVSRPAVYAWLDGTEPEKGNREKITKIAQIAFDIDMYPGYPLFHEFVNKPVLNHEKSLIDILSGNKKITVSFSELVRDIYRLTKERRERLQSPLKTGYTGNDSILDYNIDSITGKE
jgi:hypothetical protein